MAGPHSGKFGVINGEGSVRSWSISESEDTQVYYASNTKAGAGRAKGNTSWEGAFMQYLHEPNVLPGRILAFQGYTAPDDDIKGNAGEIYSGDVMIAQTVVNWNWAGGELINIEQTFQGHLTLTKSNGVPPTDATIPDPDIICGTKFEISRDGAIWNDLEHLLSATLTLTNDVQPYVNSSTNCETGRKAGNDDWSLSITQQTTKNTSPEMQLGEDVWLRGYVDATTFWLLKRAHVISISDTEVDVEGGTIIDRTFEIGMHVLDGVGALGEVTSPDGVTWYDGAA